MTVEIANVVGSGDLGRELNLEALETDLSTPFLDYDPSNYHGLYVRLEDGGPLVTVYGSGKYIISGCGRFDELETTNAGFLHELGGLGIIDEKGDTGFTVQNLVCTGTLGDVVSLNELSTALGLELTEYEPEQFPGLIYRPVSIAGVMLVFGNGNVVITGCRTIDEAEVAFQHLQDEVAAFLRE